MRIFVTVIETLTERHTGEEQIGRVLFIWNIVRLT